MKYSNRHISDEELDQLFRDAHASEGQESLFVPEFWSEMEAMLPTEKKSKRGFYWIPLAATLVLFGLMLLYPENRAQIDTLKQQQVPFAENKSNQNESETNPTVASNQSNPNSIKPENTFVQHSNNTTNLKPRVRTIFQTPKKQLVNGDSHETIDSPSKDIPSGSVVPTVVEIKKNTPEEQMPVALTSEANDQLDFKPLAPRQDRVIHDGIADLPKKPSGESNQWYLELGPTIGQSPYLSANQKRNVVGGAVLGAGYTKRIENAFVSFGLQARMEGFGGLNYQETNFSPNIVRTVSVKQLYSVEIPLKFGYVFKKSEIAFGATPGIQLFVHGKEQIIQNQVVQREESYTGKVEHSNSLTMEFGFQYYYNLSPKYSIGAKVNADVLRPFHTDYYLGKLSSFPVNGQIVIRRTFSK
jgi:hypothetical protein